MKKSLFALTFIGALFMSGCCTCKDRYEPALSQWQGNLESLRPTVVKGAESLPDEKLRKSKVGVLDTTIQAIKRVRGEGPEVWAGGAK